MFIKKYYLCLLLILISPISLATPGVYKAVTTLGPVDRPLTPSAVNAICKGIYENLTTEALNKLDISVDSPFACKVGTDKKTVVITTYIEVV